MAISPSPTDTTTSIVQTLVLYSLAEHQLGHARAADDADGHDTG